ncbi:MAG: tetratricopeptide repeat protein [Candidatus Eremiobacteraeota bacterium]|nr:tetratricopeptide repeat protein [Candidatus Eremiobacteraeota bacterium]
MSRCCEACAQDVEVGQEICSHCFAPLVSASCRFTHESTEPLGFEHPNSCTKPLPDLKIITFAPASSFYRACFQLRGGLLSALVALLFVGVGGIWWVHSHRSLGAEKTASAQNSFDKGEYGAALGCWQQALDAYHQGFDSAGQVDALVGLSRCYIRTKEFSEALVVLQRAQKIQNDETVEDALKKCHRMAAVDHLRRAQALYTPDSFGKAYLEAELAVDGFENGDGSGSQKAGAYRMAARCSVELEDFEGADAYLNKALDCEGKSKSNLALQSDIKKQYAIHRSKMLADTGANGYIPKGKLDPIAIEKAATKRSSNRSSYSSSSYSRRSTTTNYSSYQPVTYGIPQYSPPPRRVRTSLGSGTSYPTTNSGYDDHLTTFNPPQIPSNLPQSDRGALERAYSRPSSGRYRPQIVTPSTGYRPPSSYRAPSMPSTSYTAPNPYGR